MGTKIEWTDETWNPVTGCTKTSPGCANCYAETMARRLRAMGRPEYQDVHDGRGWTGRTTLVPERLGQPLRWRKPRQIFVVSMGDLFHETVPFEYIAAVFGVMAACPQHTFQVLTKRPERMVEWFRWIEMETPSQHRYGAARGVRWYAWSGAGWSVSGGIDEVRSSYRGDPGWTWPLPNVHVGVTVEDQERAYRIDHLRKVPAVVRFISYEPALSALNIDLTGIHWVICGGESGPNARPMHPDWARSLRDQCEDAGVPFLFKQWGEWVTEDQSPEDIVLPGESMCPWMERDEEGEWAGDLTAVYKVGKKAAGRLLDGRTWDEMPEVSR